jgi:S-adenosylmethionine hydrolase
MSSPIISLTTDFGLKDPYVAEMKAVLLSICPDARIVDISHEVSKFDVRMGAFVLACAVPYFPNGTIHVAVVDPNVGTRRRPLLIQTKNAFYVGPDNGLLVLAANAQAIEHIHQITNPKLMLPETSNTFHGRDVFAPAAAYLANGASPEEFGPKIKKIATPSFVEVLKKENTLVGEVLYIDSFGNIITNLKERELEAMGIKEAVNMKLENTRLKLKLCKTYAEVKKQKLLALIGSHNFLEISINQGNAAKRFKVKNGDKVTLYHS